MNPANAPAIAIERWKGNWAGFDGEDPDATAAEVGFTLVAMVSIEVAVPEAVGVTLEGEKAQVVSFGRLAQLRVVAPAKPLVEVTVMVVTAVAPPLSELLDGERDHENPGDPEDTVTATAEDDDDALSVSPP